MTTSDNANRPWYSGVTGYQWLVLVIASLGWIFDAFEGQVYVASMSLAMPALLKNSPHVEVDLFNNLAFGAFLLGGAVGGLTFGVLSDRIGRVKTMILTILFYSAFTCLSAFSQQWWHMVALRFFVALGVGGEWAVASAMVAEVFPKHARSTSLGIFHASSLLGVWGAVAVGTWIVGNPWFGPADWRWRWAFLIGVVPALLTLWVYASLREPEQWVHARAVAASDRGRQTGRLLDLFRRDLIRSTLVGLTLAAVGLATYWGVFVRGQSLVRELAENTQLGSVACELTAEQRQRALVSLPETVKTSLQRTEMLAMFVISVGAGAGGLCFAPLANRLGRRGAFLFFCLGGAAITPLLFKVLPLGPNWLLWLSLPLFGLLVNGMHAGYAVYFPELFPTRLRGTGGGFCFNGGRLLAAGVLLINGLMRSHGISLADSGSLLGTLFFLGVVILCFAPETKGCELPE